MLGQRRQAGTEHEQEQERLDERGDGTQSVGAKPDQLAPPDDVHRADVVPQAVLGHCDPDLGNQRGLCHRIRDGPLDLCDHSQRLPPRQRAALWRATSMPDASASRIVLPV